MKATGVVRRIDDLGRIVIPKEIIIGKIMIYKKNATIFAFLLLKSIKNLVTILIKSK